MSLQPQDNARLCPGHNAPSTSIGYKHTRAAPQPHGGLADPPLLPTTARPRLLLGRKVMLLLLTSAKMPAGQARARAGSPNLLRVRANPLAEQEHVGATKTLTAGWHRVGWAQGPPNLAPSPAALPARPALIAAPSN